MTIDLLLLPLAYLGHRSHPNCSGVTQKRTECEKYSSQGNLVNEAFLILEEKHQEGAPTPNVAT